TAPVAIIDRQLPFEYTIASRSTDVMVVACLTLGSMTSELQRQFENSSSYEMIQKLKSMFKKQAGVERFDLIQTFHACKQDEGKLVSSYVLKMKGYVEQLKRLGYVLLQEISVGLILNGLTSDFAEFVRNYNKHNMRKTIGTAPVAIIDRQLPFEYTIASRLTDVMVKLKSMFKKQARVERFDLIQTFHACKQDEEKLVSSYVLKIKGYVEKLERLGYVLLQEISVGLILNGLTSDFAEFAATPKVMAIQGGRIQKGNNKSLNANGKGKGKSKGNDKNYTPKPKNPKPSAKEHLEKDDACHRYKEVVHYKRSCLAYLNELINKKKQVDTANSSDIFTI
nr:zinc finger, CCHC-type [Tanacetum cinerariifolium]